MDVNVTVPVRVRDFFGIDMREPIVGENLAGNIEDHAPKGITLVGVRVHAPIQLVEIFVDRRGDIDHGLLVAPQLLVLLAVDDVSAGRLEMIGGDEDLLDNILDLFDVEKSGRVTVINNFYNF